ncbi:LURP-one-related/scramblase family protein [Halomicronema sp. CCY15110]|uniref:LURP-one-related/scramblase family protein n=1 Tax=Halomicronema sp. CCY15110 TaxID=2767773 RepID=UPI00195240E9|nr:LURP-one-related family protein [Halomicronema sp. CCY15110]
MMKRRAARNGGLLQGGNVGATPQPPVADLAGNDRRAALQNLQQSAAQRIGTRFKMRERLFSFGDDFFITNERNEKVVKVDGKLLRVRQTLIFEDMQGRELYTIKAKLIDIRETMVIKRPNGDRAAVVHNALITPLRDRWQINIPGGEDLIAQGNILQHEYSIRKKGERRPIAVISKKWFRIRDTYGVELESAFDAPLVLAITVTIDLMAHA